MEYLRVFREVMTERTINDLTLKMQALKKKTNDELFTQFFEMCDFGIKLYIETEQKRFPWKSDSDIMKNYFLTKQKR